MAPKIEALTKEEASRQGLFDAVQKLGEKRTQWPQILATLNEKIPKGVWIIELTPSYDPASRGRRRAPRAAGGESAQPAGTSPAATRSQTPAAEVNIPFII